MSSAWARAALAALFLFPAAHAGAQEAGDAFLSKVGRAYASVRTFRASFRQEIPLQNLGIVRKAAGEVAFERPLKMRWDYRGKDAQVFLADGVHFYFRPSGSPQVFRKKIDEKALGGRVPLLLLFGKGNIAEMFRVEEVTTRKGGGETALRLVPRGDGAPEVRRVDLVAGSEDFLVREIHVYDRLGGSNHIYLEGAVLNPSLSPGLFRFRKPAGTEVVDG